MKYLVLFIALSSVQVFAGPANLSYLTAEDQKYYRNDIMDGNNLQERISMDVKEINKIYGMMAQMKADIAQLQADVEELKKKK